MSLLEECRHYDHQDFKNFEEIGSGCSLVYAANWKDTSSKFAIKKISKFSTEEKEILIEVCLYGINLIILYKFLNSQILFLD